MAVLDRYKSPYTLRQIVNMSPGQSATTGGKVESAISALAAEQAQKETASQEWSQGMGTKGRELALSDLSARNRQATAEQNLKLDREAFLSKLGLEQEELANEKSQARKATAYAGIKAGLDIGGGYLAGRQADKLAAQQAETLKKVTDQMALWNEKLIPGLLGAYRKQKQQESPNNDLYQ